MKFNTIFIASQYTIFKDVISKKLVLATEVHKAIFNHIISEFFACVARSNTNVHDDPTFSEKQEVEILLTLVAFI